MPGLIQVFLRLGHSFPELSLNRSLQFSNGVEDAVAQHLMFELAEYGFEPHEPGLRVGKVQRIKRVNPSRLARWL